MISELRQRLRALGTRQFFNLLSALKRNEVNSCIPKEFLIELNEKFSLRLQQNELDRLAMSFLENRDINHLELVQTIVGELSSGRVNIIKRNFSRLTDSTAVSIGELKRNFKGDDLADVLNGRKDISEVKNEFYDSLNIMHFYLTGRSENIDKDVIPYSEFQDYYRIVSFFCLTDESFEELVDRSWSVLPRQDLNKHTFKKTRGLKGRTQTEEKESYEISDCSNDIRIVELEENETKTISQLGTKLRSHESRSNYNGVVALTEQCRILDKENSKLISFDLLQKAFKEIKLNFKLNELKVIFGLFDKNNSGELNYEAFINTILNVGKDNKARSRIRNLLVQAFKKLDQNQSGYISLFSILDNVNPAHHPLVVSNRMTADELLESLNDSLCAFFNTRRLDEIDTNFANFCLFFLSFFSYPSEYANNFEYFRIAISNIFALVDEPLVFEANDQKPEQSNERKERLFEVYEKTYHQGNDKKIPFGISQEEAKKRKEMLVKFREILRRRGSRGIMSIRRCFLMSDLDGNGVISLDEFKKMAKDYRFDLSESEVETLFNEVDEDQSGAIDYKEFVRSLVDDMPEERITRVKQIFYSLDKLKKGRIGLSVIRDGFYPGRHPLVSKGIKTPNEILAEFLDNIEYHFSLLSENDEPIEEINIEQFIDFFKHLSLTFRNSEEFNSTMEKVWNLSQF